jgi:preprotein translocase subunit SecF
MFFDVLHGCEPISRRTTTRGRSWLLDRRRPQVLMRAGDLRIGIALRQNWCPAGILVYVAARFELPFAVAVIIALLHDVILNVGAFALFDRKISLIITGAVLTLAGYPINNTIVVFDRIREGIRNGEAGSLEVIMARSMNDTLSRTILTGGTTVLSTLALYFLGGPVLFGISVETCSSIFVPSPLLLWWSRRNGDDRLLPPAPVLDSVTLK